MIHPGLGNFGIVVPRITASLSAISSSVIIIVILRSETKLSSTYHRIMFGMSAADLLSSIAMALTTLPMPRIESEELLMELVADGWLGTRRGNTQTCNLQGFFFTLGCFTMFCYNLMLCNYYAFAIAFKMNEKNIVKYIEPIFHIVPVAIGFGISMTSLVLGLYDATAWDSWCTVTCPISNYMDYKTKTLSCDEASNIGILYTFTSIGISLVVLITIICFALIIRSITKTKQQLEIFATQQVLVRSRFDLERVRNSHVNAKVLTAQAAAYIGAQITCLTFPMIQLLGHTDDWSMKMFLVFMPLQGFFNVIIFISHKIHNYRRVQKEVSRCEVIGLLFTGRAGEQIMISRISKFNIGNNDVEQEEQNVEIEVNDERGNHAIMLQITNHEQSITPESLDMNVGDLSYSSSKSQNYSGGDDVLGICEISTNDGLEIDTNPVLSSVNDVDDSKSMKQSMFSFASSSKFGDLSFESNPIQY